MRPPRIELAGGVYQRTLVFLDDQDWERFLACRGSTCSMIRATVERMARSLHVRLDDASVAALEIVRAGGLTDSEAVRTALREAAARRRVRSAIRDEVRALAADEHDRKEMRLIREQLAELAPPLGTDVVRGELLHLPAPRGVRGREQRGARYAVVVQADEFLGLSTVLVAPTSTSARPASFRPVITLEGSRRASSSSRRQSSTRNDSVAPAGTSRLPSSAPSTRRSCSSSASETPDRCRLLPSNSWSTRTYFERMRGASGRCSGHPGPAAARTPAGAAAAA